MQPPPTSFIILLCTCFFLTRVSVIFVLALTSELTNVIFVLIVPAEGWKYLFREVEARLDLCFQVFQTRIVPSTDELIMQLSFG